MKGLCLKKITFFSPLGVTLTWICVVQLLVRMEESVWTVVMVYVTHVSASLDSLVTTVKQTSVSAVFLCLFLLLLLLLHHHPEVTLCG